LRAVKVLVTGGAGFIGSHTVARLVRGGHGVRVLDNFETGSRANLMDVAQEVDVVEGDVRDYEQVHPATRGCEVIVHEAALRSVPRSIRDPLAVNASNAVGTLNVLLAARENGARRVIFASSSSVYGATEVLPKAEGLTPLPISPYAVAKLAGEGYCRSFWEVHGVETVCLRYFNVFGPRQDALCPYAGVIPKFIAACLSGRAPTIFGDGEQSRDFTYIDNVVEANLRAIDAEGVAGMVFNVGSGRGVTVNELVGELRTLGGRDVQPVYGDARRGEVRHSQADVSLAKRKLGYEPTMHFREGLALTFRYLKGLAPAVDGRRRRGVSFPPGLVPESSVAET
jgi:nucleoside-diphosphate-sugar epimerase